MTTYPLRNETGRVYAFEVENAYIQPQQIAALLSTLPQVSNVRVRMLFASPTDVHVRFQYEGHEFIVWEPYGDSDRYWIGPDADRYTPIDVNMTPLESVFKRYRLPFIVKLIGDLVSLKFLSVLKAK